MTFFIAASLIFIAGFRNHLDISHSEKSAKIRVMPYLKICSWFAVEKVVFRSLRESFVPPHDI